MWAETGMVLRSGAVSKGCNCDLLAENGARVVPRRWAEIGVAVGAVVRSTKSRAEPLREVRV